MNSNQNTAKYTFTEKVFNLVFFNHFCFVDPISGKAGCYLSEEKVTMRLRWQPGNLNGLS